MLPGCRDHREGAGWIFLFTGRAPARLRRLVRLVAERGGDAIADGRPVRQRALDLADRMLLVRRLWGTNAYSARSVRFSGCRHRASFIGTLGPLVALAPVRRRPVDQIPIFDGTPS